MTSDCAVNRHHKDFGKYIYYTVLQNSVINSAVLPKDYKTFRHSDK